MIYALLAPTVIFLVWLGFESIRGGVKRKGGRNTVFQFAERPPDPAPMRRHRPF